MADADRALTPHPIDELFSAVEDRQGPTFAELMEQRRTPDAKARKLAEIHTGRPRPKPSHAMTTAELVERATERARVKADVRANGSGEQR